MIEFFYKNFNVIVQPVQVGQMGYVTAYGDNDSSHNVVLYLKPSLY